MKHGRSEHIESVLVNVNHNLAVVAAVFAVKSPGKRRAVKGFEFNMRARNKLYISFVKILFEYACRKLCPALDRAGILGKNNLKFSVRCITLPTV